MDESLEEDTFNFLSGLIVADCREMVDSGPSRELVLKLSPFHSAILCWNSCVIYSEVMCALPTDEHLAVLDCHLEGTGCKLPRLCVFVGL